MLECPKCENDELFLQSCRGYQRRVRVYVDRGALHAERGVWKAAALAAAAEVTCGECGEPVKLTDKLRKAWRLDDEPIETTTSIELDEIMKGIQGIARGATISAREELGLAARYASLSSLNVDVSPLLK